MDAYLKTQQNEVTPLQHSDRPLYTQLHNNLDLANTSTSIKLQVKQKLEMKKQRKDVVRQTSETIYAADPS